MNDGPRYNSGFKSDPNIFAAHEIRTIAFANTAFSTMKKCSLLGIDYNLVDRAQEEFLSLAQAAAFALQLSHFVSKLAKAGRSLTIFKVLLKHVVNTEHVAS